MDADSIEERLLRIEREAFASSVPATLGLPRERRWPWWKRTASRWLTDWAALGTVLVAIVTVIDYLHIDFPLVWARDFHSFQSDQENHFQILAEGQSSLTLSIKTMLLQNVQREIRQMQSDRDQLVASHKPCRGLSRHESAGP